MEIDISGRHFHVTEALKKYASEKVKKLDKYALKLEAVHVVLEVQKFTHLAEITTRGKNSRHTAKEMSTDMYAAFDKSFGNIQLQLRKQHDKVKSHKVKNFKEKRLEQTLTE